VKQSHGGQISPQQHSRETVPKIEEDADADAAETAIIVGTISGGDFTMGVQVCSTHSEGTTEDASRPEDQLTADAEVEQSRDLQLKVELSENNEVACTELDSAKQSGFDGTEYGCVAKLEPCESWPSLAMRQTQYGTSRIHGKPRELALEDEKTCRLCHQIFASRAILKRHMVVHSEDRPFACNVCGKSFRRSDTLSAHLTTHSRQRPQ
jgi:Zinc finger, C2H2 type/Zinc-finger of C2H2 type